MNTLRRLARVTRFRAETDQATRWLAYALLEAEKCFSKIHGLKDLLHLVAALSKKQSIATEASLTEPLPSPAAPVVFLSFFRKRKVD
ncbi:MAG: hypothetical protein AAF483_27210 [Planctomycetota bacterium]